MQSVFQQAPNLRKPGLFVTATDTDVGKTVVTCAIAWSLLRADRNLRVGVSKPLASGCRQKGGQLFNDDALALAHFGQCRQPLGVINPVRYLQPLAPAVAAEVERTPVDFDAVAASLQTLDHQSDVVLVEAIGGAMTPIDQRDPKRTVVDLARAVGYPVLIVARARLGTLSHTAMTVAVLRAAGCRIAGVVINGYDRDDDRDPSRSSNHQWITRMTDVPVLAIVPQANPSQVVAHEGRLPQAILQEVAATHWAALLSPPG